MAAPLTLGLVRIGAIDLAVPAALIEEVVRGPVDLTGFPGAPLHILGAFALRGNPVPVVDLAVLIKPQGRGEPVRPVDFVIVIRHPGGRFAIQVDAMRGIVNAAVETISLVETRCEQGGALFSQLYTPAGGGRVAVMLDLDALLAVEGVRSAIAPVKVTSDFDKGARAPTKPHLLFRAGGVCIAVDSVVVKQVERRASVLESRLDHPILLGFHLVRGELVPVVNPTALLGLPALQNDAGGQYFLVIESRPGEAAVALCVDALAGMAPVGEDDIQPISEEGGVAHAECFAGSLFHALHGVVLVLKSAEFLKAVAIFEGNELSEGNGAATAQLQEEAVAVRYLVYRAGGSFLATPLMALEAVASVPPDYVNMRESGRALMGMCSQNGRPVKLIDLAMLLGKPPLAVCQGLMVVIINTGRELQGYVVESLTSLQSAVPQPLPHAGFRKHGEVPPFSQMIRTRADGRDQAVCVLNLADIAATPSVVRALNAA